MAQLTRSRGAPPRRPLLFLPFLARAPSQPPRRGSVSMGVMKNSFAEGKSSVLLGCGIIAAVGWISGGSCQVDSQAVTVAAATVAGSATLARQYQCRGARGSSEITRTRQSDGGETLRGETDVPFSPGSTGR